MGPAAPAAIFTPASPSPIVVRAAHGKLNLMLSVGGPAPADAPRPGFHPIASWMSAIDLADEVRVERLEPGIPSRLTVRWADDAPRPSPIDWPPDRDLAARAHGLLEAHAARPLPAAIDLVKRLPVGGGLGGGSSDAAATLLALDAAFALALPHATLVALGAQLGSDVPFFLGPRADGTTPAAAPPPALVTGMGETLAPMAPVPGEVVLIIPDFGCATGPVYATFDALVAEAARRREVEHALKIAATGTKSRPPEPQRARPDLILKRHAKMANHGALSDDLLFNDLALAAYAVEPRLGALVTALSNATRQTAHVTGSGSCVFLPTSRAHADRLLRRVSLLLETLRSGAGPLAGVRIVALRARLIGG